MRLSMKDRNTLITDILILSRALLLLSQQVQECNPLEEQGDDRFQMEFHCMAAWDWERWLWLCQRLGGQQRGLMGGQ